MRAGVTLRWVLVFSLGAACSSGRSESTGQKDAAVRVNPFADGGFHNPERITASDAGPIVISDAAVSGDAFFINDPQPPTCGEDGRMSPPAEVNGTLECPTDKNREGCECKTPGEVAKCWPGQRVNRNHGVCHDGKTRCQEGFEFGHRWGPCEGYELPVEGATTGPEACRCFSNGTWRIANLVPCIFEDVDHTLYIYSSRTEGTSGFTCDPVTMVPPATPSVEWTPSSLSVDCGGRFELCYSIKAGDVAKPSADDCVVTRQCVTTWYPTAGAVQQLPSLPGWMAADTACARRFVEEGGYGEMSVVGKSLECEAVDDGSGKPLVFKRASYCPPRCGDAPQDPVCAICAAGGAGEF